MISTYEKSRVKNFSDAVFSIALTLLVLDIDVPTQRELTKIGFDGVLTDRIAQFIGFVVSFLVISIFWKAHLRNFRHAKFVDDNLLSLNTILLLFIALLPFTTAFYVNNFGFNGPFRFYCLNLVLIGLINMLSLRYIYKSHLNEGSLNLNTYRYYFFLGFNVTIVWLLAIILSTFAPYISRCIFILIFILNFFAHRYYKRKEKAFFDI